jgi:hypothetical protein
MTVLTTVPVSRGMARAYRLQPLPAEAALSVQQGRAIGRTISPVGTRFIYNPVRPPGFR